MENNRPNTIPWPPAIYLGSALVGVILQTIVPIAWPANATANVLAVLGIVLGLAALALDLTTFATFRKHKTTVMPHKAATNLITSGPFAWSRNPIYVANTNLLVAAGLYFGFAWLLILAPVAAFATQKLAIEREEKHLHAKFGAQWQNYAARVRRWL